MASTLAAQLAQLAAAKGPVEHYVRGKPSMLFEYQKAADVDAETSYNIARTGERAEAARPLRARARGRRARRRLA